jgi:hypothetical protein
MRKLFHGLIAATLLALPVASQAGVFVSVTIAPPALPVYVQPPMPAPGYMWTPGYWAWDGSYYWVPGTWVMAPVGLLWTPGYWGWANGVYAWNAGYWGPHVGFYGGVNYGFGYGGVGFAGGEWRGGQLFYNRSVTNIGTTNVTNVYNRTVVTNVTVSHVSYNGGAGGIEARPNAQEIAAGREQHTGAIQAQTEHQSMASHNNALRASVNGGHPAIAATAHAGTFSGAGVVAARGATPAGHGPSASGGTHGGAYPQTHGGAYPQTHASPGAVSPNATAHQAPQPQRGGYQAQSQPQHGQPQPRGNPQREERPQHEERSPPHQTRAAQTARPERVAHTPAPQARPQQRVAHTPAPQARPQQRVSHAPAPQARPQQRVAHAPAPQARPQQRVAHAPAPQARPQQRVAHAPAPQRQSGNGGEPRDDHRHG